MSGENNDAQKARKWILSCLIIFIIALLGGWFVVQTKSNSERASAIEANLIGKTFTHIDSSKENSYLEIEAKDGSVHFIQCDYISTSEWNYSFKENGICIHTSTWTREFPSYEKRDWAKMENLTKEYGPTSGEYSVHISLSNKITVNINSSECELLLDEIDVPFGMIKNGDRYE